MAIDSSFWDAVVSGDTYDRVYSADDHANYFKDFISNGVYVTPTTSMQVVENSGLQIKINSGTCFINGRRGNSTGNDYITIDTADYTYPRIDRIVVRLSKTNRNITFGYIKGTASGIPAIPALTRNTDIWELCLANIYVSANATEITQSNITDTRSDITVCGWVTGAVEQIDTTELFAQYEAQWELLKGACEDDAPAVIAAWNALNAVKKVNNILPVDGNISLTQDNIPDSDTYFRQDYKTQRGVVTTNSSGVATVTFPTAFVTEPLIFLSTNVITNYVTTASTTTVSNTSFSIKCVQMATGFGNVAMPVNWLAMGV